MLASRNLNVKKCKGKKKTTKFDYKSSLLDPSKKKLSVKAKKIDKIPL